MDLSRVNSVSFGNVYLSKGAKEYIAEQTPDKNWAKQCYIKKLIAATEKLNTGNKGKIILDIRKEDNFIPAHEEFHPVSTGSYDGEPTPIPDIYERSVSVYLKDPKSDKREWIGDLCDCRRSQQVDSCPCDKKHHTLVDFIIQKHKNIKLLENKLLNR